MPPSNTRNDSINVVVAMGGGILSDSWASTAKGSKVVVLGSSCSFVSRIMDTSGFASVLFLVSVCMETTPGGGVENSSCGGTDDEMIPRRDDSGSSCEKTAVAGGSSRIRSQTCWSSKHSCSVKAHRWISLTPLVHTLPLVLLLGVDASAAQSRIASTLGRNSSDKDKGPRNTPAESKLNPTVSNRC